MEIPKKMIVISDCMECPIIKDCKAWENLTPKQKFTLKCGVGIGKFILNDCPLDNAPLNGANLFY
jgi:hypothetical protein